MREMFASVKPVHFEKPNGRFPRREELYDRSSGIRGLDPEATAPPEAS